MSTIDTLQLTEQLYTAKLFIVVMALCNVILSLYGVYAFSINKHPWFVFGAAVMLVFNIVFASIAFKDWRKKPNEKVKILLEGEK